jgi:hypothetical protein
VISVRERELDKVKDLERMQLKGLIQIVEVNIQVVSVS